MASAYKYVIANEGVDTSKSYPFYGKVSCLARERFPPSFPHLGLPSSQPKLQIPFSPVQQYSCVYDENSAGAKMSGIVKVKSGSESDLMGAVANVGPVSVAVDGSSNAFRVSSYTLYHATQCSEHEM